MCVMVFDWVLGTLYYVSTYEERLNGFVLRELVFVNLEKIIRNVTKFLKLVSSIVRVCSVSNQFPEK